ASFFSGLPNLLTPLQILFVNIIMDGPPAIALGFEKPAKETIKEKPRKGKEIFSKNLALSIFSTSIFMAAISLLVFLYFSSNNPEIAVTATFATFVMLQLFNSLNCRSAKDHFYSSPNSNKYIFITFIVLTLILYLAIQIPEINVLFGAKALDPYIWIIAIISASSILVFEELKKLFFKQVIVY
ncbi:MAG: cation-translocating P-type ATPase C-terminal domain-containing protein, partial [Candidatus ainarchaeum sp.]|nr:cation-translocating P-type ATPase C-terminal domain-containing protein [Candidatus ainarchaeum sp.]